MAVQLDEVRTLALGLPDTTEEPHHDFGSHALRVSGSSVMPVRGAHPLGANVVHQYESPP